MTNKKTDLSPDSAIDESRRNGPDQDIVKVSNAVQLSPREWLITGVIVTAAIVATPDLWSQVETFDVPEDYRIPYANSEDYWLYRRLIRSVIDEKHVPLIGDSVIWGEYVAGRQTLSHFMNTQHGSVRFVNGGVNATHPLALEGLVQAYAANLVDRPVILHFNALWLSSADRDLQVDQELAFNHPRLIPQLIQPVPSYKAPTTERMAIVVDRRVPFRGWVTHLRISWFEDLDLHSWSLEHPYANPLAQIGLRVPQASHTLRHRPVSWSERGIEQQEFPWIELETSLQWRAFKNTVELLRSRGNKLFVIVGPFNQHVMSEASRKTFLRLRRAVESWLEQNEVRFYAFELLPSDEYADASHPLSQGYERMAKQVFEDKSFRQWLGKR